MAKSPSFRAVPPPDCQADHPCLNIERVRKEFGIALSGLDGEFKVNRQMIADLRVAVSEIPRAVTAQIDKEAAERTTRLTRGEGHFDEIFLRLGKLEKAVISMWIVVGIIGAAKFVVWALPAIGGLW